MWFIKSGVAILKFKLGRINLIDRFEIFTFSRSFIYAYTQIRRARLTIMQKKKKNASILKFEDCF